MGFFIGLFRTFSNHAYWNLAGNLTPTEMDALVAFLQSRKKTSLILFDRANFHA
jgi:hypothetical protein